MARYLVIVESPAKAKTIQKILGKDYIVTASYGHVRDLQKAKIGKGKDSMSGVDIPNDFEPHYEVLPNKAKTIKEILQQAKRVEKVFLCPDPDREGEAIAFHLKELIGPSATFSRVTYNEITPKAILDAFAHPRDLDMNLVNSQQARRILDRIVGYKISPLLWKKIKRGLSAGRVQSVAVRMVSEREKEIQAFVPREYHTVSGQFDSGDRFYAQLKVAEDKKVVCSAADLERFDADPVAYIHLDEPLAKSFTGRAWSLPKGGGTGEYVVTTYDEKEVKERPYPPFSTSNLQAAAAVRLGYDAKRTMSIAQQLYEGVGSDHGLITYMRTDSFNVSKDAQAEAKDFVEAKFGKDHYPDKPNLYASKKGAQEAHECVRPTDVNFTPDDAKSVLNEEQLKLYALIWRRFVASQMSPAVYDSVSCELDPVGSKPGELTFRATGRKLKFPGWTAVYERDEDEDKKLPAMSVGQKVKLVEAASEKHMTEPPPRFTDATIVKLLEKEGIGRPSTYASIIAVIQDRGYVEKVGRGGRAPFKATTLGMLVTDSLVGHFPAIMDVGFTRDMEERLDEVEEGNIGHVKVLEDFYKEFMEEMDKADKAMPTKKGGEPTGFPCPKCGENMTKFLGRFGEFLACPKCKAKQNLDADGNPKDPEADLLPILCDKCGSQMTRAKGRFGEYIKCSKEGCKFTMGLTKGGMPKRKLAAEPTKLKCPKCSKPLVIRVSARGKMPKPKPFCSCSGFPKCRHAEELPEDLKSVGEEVVRKWQEIRELDRRDMAKMNES